MMKKMRISLCIVLILTLMVSVHCFFGQIGQIKEIAQIAQACIRENGATSMSDIMATAAPMSPPVICSMTCAFEKGGSKMQSMADMFLSMGVKMMGGDDNAAEKIKQCLGKALNSDKQNRQKREDSPDCSKGREFILCFMDTVPIKFFLNAAKSFDKFRQYFSQ